ncbi:hypothetical protein N657DRAFT_680642 [Parathielavia appendiculata]|uniref:Sin3 associated polypeptide p18 n=1 Tax=Parathielavia appendiculata TaxID=2587402 RepID=A0AAN6TZ86_9PEZI|nr:hypothetical protein N657DRAFT_680642 [Parathielavia appendiculata]
MSTGGLNRAETPPFHLKLFYRTGAFHRPDEFNTSQTSLPPHLSLHTWPDCTLLELSHHLLDASPSILPSPAIGTRICFRLIYVDTRASANRIDRPHMPRPRPRYVAKDLGTVVLGRGGPGAGPDEGVPDDEPDAASEDVTLADARFITGDLLSCAILPPDEVTGDVMPASSARTGRGAGVGETRVPRGGDAPPGGLRGRGLRGGGGGRRGSWGYGEGRFRVWDEPFGRGGGGGGVPEGEWRRGDMLPEGIPKGGRWSR